MKDATPSTHLPFLFCQNAFHIFITLQKGIGNNSIFYVKMQTLIVKNTDTMYKILLGINFVRSIHRKKRSYKMVIYIAVLAIIIREWTLLFFVSTSQNGVRVSHVSSSSSLLI